MTVTNFYLIVYKTKLNGFIRKAPSSSSYSFSERFLWLEKLISKFSLTIPSLAAKKARICLTKVRSLSFNCFSSFKSENDELAKALGKATVERDWALGKLRSLDIPNKRDLVDSKLKELSMARQCGLLKINRSMLYYQPKIMSLYNKKIMDRIDEIYTDNPDYGYRFMHKSLLEEGFVIGRDRTLK